VAAVCVYQSFPSANVVLAGQAKTAAAACLIAGLQTRNAKKKEAQQAGRYVPMSFILSS